MCGADSAVRLHHGCIGGQPCGYPQPGQWQLCKGHLKKGADPSVATGALFVVLSPIEHHWELSVSQVRTRPESPTTFQTLSENLSLL